MDKDARIRERILKVATSRIGREIATPAGDLIPEELGEDEARTSIKSSAQTFAAHKPRTG
jgi:hypothetical protein